MINHEYYAHAFYRALKEDKVASYREFSTIADIFASHPQLISTLLFDGNKINEIEDWLLKDVSIETKRFIHILIEDGIIEQIERVKLDLRELLIQDGIWNVCTVEIAQEISEEAFDKIKDVVRRNYEGYIEFSLVLNESLRAGYRLLINDRVIDLSVEGRLNRLIEEVNYG